MKRLALALLALLILAPAAARAQETCTCNSESFDWASVADPAGWDGCTPSAGDTFQINGACFVTTTGAITGTGNMAITVQSTGVLNMNHSITTAGTGGVTLLNTGSLIGNVTATQIVLTLGSAGLSAAEGTTVRLSGKVRTWGTSSASLLDEPSNTSYFQAGDIYPCPGDSGTSYNCATDPSRMRMSYTIGGIASPPNDWSEADQALAGNPTSSQRSYFTTNFDAITTDDVIVFFDPDPEDAITYPEVNQPFEVVARGAASPRTLDFETYQGGEGGTENTAGAYPLTRRYIRSALLDSAVTTGQRQFVFAPAGAGEQDVVAADMDMAARWLRFAPKGATTAPAESVAYMIAYAKEAAGYADPNSFCTALSTPIACCSGVGAGTCVDLDTLGTPNDTLRIANRFGVPNPHDSGDRVWVGGPGIRKGDPFFVMVPLRVVHANVTDGSTGDVNLNGNVTLRNVVFQRPNSVNVGSVATEGTIEEIARVWIQDTCGGAVEPTFLVANRSGTVGPLYATGGCSAKHETHGIGVGCSSNLTLKDISIRHSGDDNFLLDDTSFCGAGESDHITLRRFRAEYEGSEASSQACLDWGGGSTTGVGYTATDVYCGGTGTDDTVFAGDPSPPAAGVRVPYEVNRAVVIGSTAGLSNADDTTSTINDLIAVGTIESPSNGFHLMGGAAFNRFSVRDTEIRSVNTQIAFSNAATFDMDLRNGIFDTLVQQRLSLGIYGGVGINTMNLQNLALIDVFNANTCTTSCKMIQFLDASGITIENVGIAYRTGSGIAAANQFAQGFSGPANGTAITDVTLGGLLVSGMTNTANDNAAYELYWNSGAGYNDFTYTGPICSWNNRTDFSNDMRNDGTGGSACDPGDVCNWIESYAEVIRDRSPEFYNPLAGPFGIIKSASGVHAKNACGPKIGAAAPGVKRQMWAASLAGLGPEYLADPTSGGGGGGMWPRAY